MLKNFDSKTSRAGLMHQMNRCWERVLHLATRVTHAPHSPLILTGQALLDFYYIHSGRIRIMHGQKNGQERAIIYIGEGNIFNEATAIAGFDDPDCQFYCLSHVELYRFSGKLLQDSIFIRENPELISNLMLSLSRKVLTMHATISNSGGRSSHAHVARYLCSLVELHNGALEFAPELTQDEMALFLGIHRATLVRSLQLLREKNIIACFRKHCIQILDIQELQNIANL